jgi:hypothetical protein
MFITTSIKKIHLSGWNSSLVIATILKAKPKFRSPAPLLFSVYRNINEGVDYNISGSIKLYIKLIMY